MMKRHIVYTHTREGYLNGQEKKRVSLTLFINKVSKKKKNAKTIQTN